MNLVYLATEPLDGLLVYHRFDMTRLFKPVIPHTVKRLMAEANFVTQLDWEMLVGLREELPWIYAGNSYSYRPYGSYMPFSRPLPADWKKWFWAIFDNQEYKIEGLYLCDFFFYADRIVVHAFTFKSPIPYRIVLTPLKGRNSS